MSICVINFCLLFQENWTIERIQWEEHYTEKVQWIELENLYGEIRLRSGPNLLFTANKQYPEGQKDPFEFSIKHAEKGIVVKVLSSRELGNKERLDFSLFIPEDWQVSVKTRNGLIESKGIKGSIKARASGGEIKLTTKNQFSAQTDSGNITVHLDRYPDRLASLMSGSGDISLLLDLNQTGKIEIETQGHIASDFTMQVHKSEANPNKKAEIFLGKSKESTAIKIQTRRGNVKVLTRY